MSRSRRFSLSAALRSGRDRLTARRRSQWFLLVGLVTAVVLGVMLLLPGQNRRAEAADDTCTPGFGTTVSNGVPCAGAGNIEVNGNRDIYTYTAAAGSTAFFNSLSTSSGLRWQLQDSTWRRSSTRFRGTTPASSR